MGEGTTKEVSDIGKAMVPFSEWKLGRIGKGAICGMGMGMDMGTQWQHGKGKQLWSKGIHRRYHIERNQAAREWSYVGLRKGHGHGYEHGKGCRYTWEWKGTAEYGDLLKVSYGTDIRPHGQEN